MNFFDFLAGNPKYEGLGVARLNCRHRFLIETFAGQIEGSRVLDLAAHDGRWSYALAACGAREVLGIEGRPELVQQFVDYPDAPFKARVRLEAGDIFDGVRGLVERSETFDVVALFGIYYHIMDHYGLLALIHRLAPRLILVDSEFMTAPWPHVAMALENVAKDVNATARVEGQRMVPIGVPSCMAMERMAGSLGYAVQWLDWNMLPVAERGPVGDYFRTGPKRRFTCALTPEAGVSAFDSMATADPTPTIQLDGLSIIVDPSYSSKIVEFLGSGRYEHTERAALRAMLTSTDKVLELGGAIGVVAMSCARIVGAENVVSVEANPALIKHAHRNFARNGVQIAIRHGVMKNAAFWRGPDERVAFYVERDFWASSLVRRSATAQRISVPVLCLEQEIAAASANVLICDIEGGEIDLLSNADLSPIEKLIVEVHPWATGVPGGELLVQGLQRRGFSLDPQLSVKGLVCMRRDDAESSMLRTD